uniref:Uncharacterized protein n=1 Tax=Arundo donax TaxID=35708 RepID=A0A0A8YEF9_ARUDO
MWVLYVFSEICTGQMASVQMVSKDTNLNWIHTLAIPSVVHPDGWGRRMANYLLYTPCAATNLWS